MLIITARFDILSAFFTQQLDYIFFFYGLAFILLMAVCVIEYRQGEQKQLPWLLLGLFGLLHGINEWLDMLALSLGDGRFFFIVRLVIMAVSFAVLAEFGREGLHRVKKGLGVWIYLPLIAFAIAGASSGPSALNVSVRYSFGLASGTLATLALWRVAGSGSENRLLRGAAVIMALYTIAAGAIVPSAPFLPASVINHDNFLMYVGLPIQLVRGILAVCFTAAIWNHHIKTRQALIPAGELTRWTGTQLTSIIVFLLVAGWFGTQLFDHEAMQEVRNDILQLSTTAAASINAERISNVIQDRDPKGSEYVRLRRQLIAIHETNLQLHLLRLLHVKDGQAIVAVDSAAEWDTDHKEPGSHYHTPPQVLFEVFSNAVSRTVGPYKDEDGTFVSGFAPIAGPEDGKPIAVLCMDVSADSWGKMEAKYRLIAIVTTLFFTALVTAFFIITRRMQETADLLAASRKTLAEAEEQKRLELEAMNRSLEQLVAVRTAKLNESNRELQYFAYIASHDLQEPLRTITSFIQLLGKRYQDRLDQDAREFMGFISDGAIRMQQLINDLLTYSRVESKGKQFTLFDGKRAVEHSLANLRAAIEESGAEITADDIPPLYGDEVQIAQLFQNLVGNAIKFHGAQAPKVHISYQELPEAHQIAVGDNGIGIEPRFFERIFEIFQRLHSREQYGGTGIGLAVCKKIVERHGGRIWVESEIGRGTTFRFTIRKHDATPMIAVTEEDGASLSQ